MSYIILSYVYFVVAMLVVEFFFSGFQIGEWFGLSLFIAVPFFGPLNVIALTVYDRLNIYPGIFRNQILVLVESFLCPIMIFTVATWIFHPIFFIILATFIFYILLVPVLKVISKYGARRNKNGQCRLEKLDVSDLILLICLCLELFIFGCICLSFFMNSLSHWILFSSWLVICGLTIFVVKKYQSYLFVRI